MDDSVDLRAAAMRVAGLTQPLQERRDYGSDPPSDGENPDPDGDGPGDRLR